VTASVLATPSSADYEFAPEDRPAFPGGPYAPPHPTLRRLGYAGVGIWIGAVATFSNAMVTVNVPNLSGELSTYVAQLSVLPAIYVAANASANTMLIKARAQFSMPHVMRVLLLVYVVVAALQFYITGFAAEVVARFVSGVVAAGMTSLGVYYLLQSLPPKAHPVALIAGLGLTQLGTPLARLVPVDVLSAQGWQGQHCIELAVALTTLALITLLPLPPTPRLRAFQPLDFLTVALLLPAMLLVCGVLGQGRLAWWTDTPWIGVHLAIAVPMLTAVFLIEALRSRPLIQIGWMGTRDFLSFAAIALLMRLALAEQTYGSVGLLSVGNLDNDQLRTLFGWVIVSMLAGIVVSAVTLSERAIPWQVIVAALSVALGAWMDSHSSNLTRPDQLCLSQSLIGFGTCMFIGPTLAHGILKVLRLGPAYLVTLVVVFSMTQNVGSLIGSAALGSYQTAQTREHYLELASRIPSGDAMAQARIQAETRALGGVVGDPAIRAQQGGASLVASLTREANILAFNDVFRLVFRLALATAGLVGCLMLISAMRPTGRSEPV
jgi:hypothetical protein